GDVYRLQAEERGGGGAPAAASLRVRTLLRHLGRQLGGRPGGLPAMAELEIHHEGGEGGHDPTGQRVGVLAALLAVALAIVTIASHRTHTAAIIHKSEVNDAWEHYQSTRVKFHNLELGENLVKIFGAKGESADKM